MEYNWIRREKSPNNLKCALKIMKVLTTFLFIVSFSVAANTYSQESSITIKLTNATIKEIFSEIEKRTDYVFLISGNLGNEVNRRVDIDIDTDSVDEVMKIITSNSVLKYEVLDKQIVIYKGPKPLKSDLNSSKNLYQEQQPIRRQVSGVVTDKKDGLPVIGANVSIPNTSVGTITNEKGQFSLSVPVGSKLRFSYIGYVTQDFTITNQTTLNVQLVEDISVIDEVVVTGIMVRKAENYTGSTQSYSKDQLQSIGNQNLFESLKNLDASMIVLDNFQLGSNPNALPELQLRGTSTFDFADETQSLNLKGNYLNKPNQPLFILDGFETSIEKIMDMDMNRIERIDILKDAASKAIYGSQAANGVIIIETSKHDHEGARITYNGGISFEMPDLTSYNLTNAAEKLEVELLEGVYDLGKLPDFEAYNKRKKLIQEGVDTYWLSKPLQTGIGNKHFISVELGEDRLKSIIDFSYNKITGAMKGSSRTTISGDINLSYRTNKLLFRNITSITQNKSKDSPYGNFDDYVKMNPYSEVYDENGNISKTYDRPPDQKEPNPLYYAGMNVKKDAQYIQFNNNFYTEWTIIPDLKATLRLGISSKKNEYDEYYPFDHYVFRLYSNTDRHRRGSFQKNNGSQTILSGDFFVNYVRTFGKHTFFANARSNIGQNRSKEIIVNTEGFPNEAMNDIIYAMQYRENSRPNGINFLRNEIGFSGLVSYVFDDRFLSDFTIRNNASSMFGDNSKWANFWSIGLGYNLHNEQFVKNTGVINYLKLRGSVGTSGNQNFSSNKAIGAYEYIMGKFYTYYWGGSRLKNLENKDLKWEHKLDYNLGVDMKLLGFDIRFDYYRSITENLLTDLNIVTSTGFSSVAENIGRVENKGIEVSTRYTFWQGKDGFLAGNVSFSTNKNRIMELSEAMKHFNETQDKLASKMGTKPVHKYVDGMSMNEIWAVPSLGIDPSNGNELLVDRYGNTTYTWNPSDMVPSGSSEPRYRGIFGIIGEYKGFGINTNFRFLGGGYMYNQTLVDRVENADVFYNLDRRVLTGRWKEPGQQTLFKRIGRYSVYDYDDGKYVDFKTRPSTRFVQKRNELIFGNLTLYYDFNREVIQKYGFERLKLSFFMNDIATFSTIRIERGTSYPFARNFSLSLMATF